MAQLRLYGVCLIFLFTYHALVSCYDSNNISDDKKKCGCNGHGHCENDERKCVCTTKGVVGDLCDRCDTYNHYHGDPTDHGHCFYDLTINYQFTFYLNKTSDQRFSRIDFEISPTNPDVDTVFSISCSVPAVMNITSKTATGGERPLVLGADASKFLARFLKSDHQFGTTKDGAPLTTFRVYVYDMRPPIELQISFSQYPTITDVLWP